VNNLKLYMVKCISELAIMYDNPMNEQRLELFVNVLSKWFNTKESIDYVMARILTSFKAEYGVKFPSPAVFFEQLKNYWVDLAEYNKNGSVNKLHLKENGIPENIFSAQPKQIEVELSEEQKKIREEAIELMSSLKQKFTV
jgi:hypothetical protein